MTTMLVAVTCAGARDIQSSPNRGSQEWAQAELEFEHDPSGRTFLRRQHVTYPFHVTRPLFLDPGSPGFATLYLQSLSGGLVQGDRFKIAVRVEAGAAVLVTTPSATKAHSMERAAASHSAELEVAAGGHLEYTPEATILFPGTRVLSAIRLRISEGGSAILTDSLLSHDPWADPPAPFDHYQGSIAIERPDGTLLALDRIRLDGQSIAANAEAFAGLSPGQRRGAIGTVVVCSKPPVTTLVAELRRAVAQVPEAYSGVTALLANTGALVRVIAPDGATLRRVVTVAWQSAHQFITGKAILPRRK